MRATLWAATGVLTALAAAGGCQGRIPAEAENRAVVRPALGLALDVPQGWTFHDLSGDVVLEMYPAPASASPAAAEPAEAPAPRATPVVHVLVLDREGLSLDAWADQAVTETKEMTAGLEVVSRNPAQRADGRAALELQLRSLRGVRPLVQRMLLVMTDTRAYALIATAPEGDLAAAAPAFDKCFSSLVVW